MAEEKEKGNMPDKKYRAGGITATVWKNIGKTSDGREFDKYNVTLSRSYKDKDGNWKETNSYNAADIPKVILVANKAYEHISISEKEE